MAAAHGGQILVSGDTGAAIDARCPVGVSLRSLGGYELRGLEGLQELFQVDADGMLADFPPPSTA